VGARGDQPESLRPPESGLFQGAQQVQQIPVVPLAVGPQPRHVARPGFGPPEPADVGRPVGHRGRRLGRARRDGQPDADLRGRPGQVREVRRRPAEHQQVPRLGAARVARPGAARAARPGGAPDPARLVVELPPVPGGDAPVTQPAEHTDHLVALEQHQVGGVRGVGGMLRLDRSESEHAAQRGTHRHLQQVNAVHPDRQVGVVGVGDGEHGLQRGVQDGGRQVLGDRGVLPLQVADRQFAVPGNPPYPLERRAVGHAEVDEPGVQVVGRQHNVGLARRVRLGAQPRGQVGVRRLGRARPGPDPRSDVAPLERSAGRSGHHTDDLDLGTAVGQCAEPGAHLGRVLGQQQRRMDAQVLDRPPGLAVHRITGRQQGLQVCRGRHHHLAHGEVVAQVRRPVGRQPGRELADPGAGRHLRPEQRVVHRPGGRDGAAAVPATGDRQPVPLAVEGVRRQFDPPAVAGVVVGPGHRQPGGVQLGQRGADGRAVGVGPVGAGQPQVVGGGDAPPAQLDQVGGRTDLEERVLAALRHGTHAGREVDRFEEVPYPVPGAGQLGWPGHRAGQVGDQGQLGLVVPDVGDGVPELLGHLRHQRRVERVRDRQRPGRDAALGQCRGEGRQRLAAAGDHALLRRVHRGDSEVRVGREQRRDQVEARPHGAHPAGCGHRLHEPRPGRDQGHRVLQAEQPRDGCGGDLADAVPDQHARPHAPRPP